MERGTAFHGQTMAARSPQSELVYSFPPSDPPASAMVLSNMDNSEKVLPESNMLRQQQKCHESQINVKEFQGESRFEQQQTKKRAGSFCVACRGQSDVNTNNNNNEKSGRAACKSESDANDSVTVLYEIHDDGGNGKPPTYAFEDSFQLNFYNRLHHDDMKSYGTTTCMSASIFVVLH